MHRIKELPKSSAHLISSTQVITSIHSVIKELIENSIDSKAKNIEVKLDDFGLDKIEVKDNGSGIHKEDICFVAKPHCTSKITSHLDLVTVETYGFRGEALAALCAVSDLTISTKTASDEFGFTYTFNHKGEVLSSKPCSLNEGTVITALNLFKNIPVRKQIYRNGKVKKEELKKIEDLLFAFGCVQAGLRFMLYHNKNIIWQKIAAKSTTEGLQQIFECSVFEQMEKIFVADDETKISIEMFLPKPNNSKLCSQSTPCRTVVAVNKRPVRMKLFDKLLKEHFSKVFESDKPSYPTCYVSINVPSSEIDVNFEPNKTAVALQNNEQVISLLSDALKEFYSKNVPTETSSSTTSITTKSSNNNCPPITVEPSRNVPSRRNETQSTDSTSIITQNNHFVQKQVTEQPKTQHLTENSKPHNSSGTLFGMESQMSSRDIVVVGKKNSPPKDLNTSSCKRVRNLSRLSSGTKKLDLHIQAIDSFFTNSQTNSKTLEATPSSTNETPLIVNVQRRSSTEDVDVIRTEKPSLLSQSILTTFTPKKNQESDCVLKIPDHNENQAISNISPGSSEWSRGTNGPKKDLIGPVAVLHPNHQEVNQNIKETINPNLEREKKVEKRRSDEILNKRELTPFDFFCRRYRLEVAAMNPEMSNQQLAQILTEKWNNLSSDEKTAYQNMGSKNNSDFKAPEKQKEGSSPGSEKENKSHQKPKKLRKKKYKYIEKTITFNVNDLKDNISLESDFKSNKDFDVISSLSSGLWICCQKSKLHLLDCVRLHEKVIYNRLLQTFQLEAKNLDHPFVISTSSLEKNEWNVISQLACLNRNGNDLRISDERIVANGFDIRLLKEENEISLEVVGVTEDIPFYSISDLKEILLLIKVKGNSANLLESRPQKVITFLQGEAVRIARQYPGYKRREFIEDLLEVSKSISVPNTYSKPFLHEFFTLPPD